MPTLVIQIPDMPAVEHVLKEEAMTIGRMKGNSIALDHSSVSLSHAKLTRIGGDYFLKDLNSTNGTLLNGQSVTEARLRDGDHVKFGEVSARYHTTNSALLPEPAAAPTSATPAPSAPVISPAPVPVASAAAAPPPLSAAVQLPRPAAAPAPISSAPPPAMRKPPGPVPSSTPPAPSFASKKPKAKLKIGLLPIAAGAAGLVVVGVVVWLLTRPVGSGVAPHPAPPVVQMPANIPPPVKSPMPSPTLQPVPTDAGLPAPPDTKQDVPALIKALKSTDPAERRLAASTLNAMATDAKDAVPALREALNDTDPEVRQWSALCLIHNKVYDKGTVPILLQLLHNDNPMMRQVACFSLALIPYEEPEKAPVIAALTQSVSQDADMDVRNAAASSLKAIIPDNLPAVGTNAVK